MDSHKRQSRMQLRPSFTSILICNLMDKQQKSMSHLEVTLSLECFGSSLGEGS
jgi:hypothetical protein